MTRLDLWHWAWIRNVYCVCCVENQRKKCSIVDPKMQKFTAEKWADKIALFIDNLGVLSGFFDIGLLLYPLPHHTLQCCTRKSFWVTRTGESKLFCIGFSLFWSRCRKWSTNCFPLLSSFSTFLHLAASSCHNFLLFSTKWPDAWTPVADLWRLQFMGQCVLVAFFKWHVFWHFDISIIISFIGRTEHCIIPK